MQYLCGESMHIPKIYLQVVVVNKEFIQVLK